MECVDKYLVIAHLSESEWSWSPLFLYIAIICIVKICLSQWLVPLHWFLCLGSLFLYIAIICIVKICLSQWPVPLVSLDSWVLFINLSGISYSIGSQRWTVEKRLYANGWRTLETAIEQGLLHVRGNKEGAFPVACYQWKVTYRWLTGWLFHSWDSWKACVLYVFLGIGSPLHVKFDVVKN